MLLAVLVTATLAQAAPPPPAVRPLAGQKPCDYPAAARKLAVAGPVRFVAQVAPDGTAESVEVVETPVPDAGFEDAVRSCVLQWRFEPAPGGSPSSRRFAGIIRYQLSPPDEKALRQLLESLTAAWNESSEAAIEDLESRPNEVPGLPPATRTFLSSEVKAAGAGPGCRLQLDRDVSSVRFLRRDLVELRQPFTCAASSVGAGALLTSGPRTLELTAVKGPRGWRFAFLPASDKAWFRVARVGGAISEPRKLKNVSPVYPDVAQTARVQGVVILECVISAEGKVVEIRVLRGIPLLDQAAIDAVRQWEYTPTLVDGKAVPVIMTVTVNFTLS